MFAYREGVGFIGFHIIRQCGPLLQKQLGVDEWRILKGKKKRIGV